MSQPTQPTLGLSSHNNHYLFSDHYLNEILRRSPAWQETRESARPLLDWLRELYAREQAQLSQYNESQLEDNWFKPILERLDHAWEGQTTIPGLGGGIAWEVYLDEPLTKHQVLTSEIVRLVKAPNAHIYTLIDLEPDEIRIIEESTKYPYGAI